MITPATREELLAALLDSMVTLLRTMMADPTLPAHAREAFRQRVVEIEAALSARAADSAEAVQEGGR